MSRALTESVNLRETGVVQRWSDHLQGLFAGMYGPKASVKLVENDDEWSLVADAPGVLSTIPVTTPMTDLWTSLVEGQTDRYGDGATFAALLALSLTRQATDLVERGLHPATIQRGYTAAYRITRETLDDMAVKRTDQETLQALLRGVAAGDGVTNHPAVEAISRVAHADESSFRPQVLARNRGADRDTRAIPGVILTKEPEDADRLPLIDAHILLIDEKLYIEEETDEDSRSRTAPTALAKSPETVRRIEATVSDIEATWADRILSVDPDLVVTLKGTAESIRRRLSDADVTLVHRAKPTDALNRLAMSTGATVVSRIEDVDQAHLGRASRVEYMEFNNLEYVLIHGRERGPWSLIVRKWNWSTTDLVEEAIDALVTVSRQAAANPSYVPGGGGTEVQLATAVREKARGMDGRDHLAAMVYADALEETVQMLATNLGRDPATSLAALRHADAGAGLVGDRDEVGDALSAGVVDLATVKRGALAAATNTALTLLRVDSLLQMET